MGIIRPLPGRTEPVTSRRIFNNFRAEMDRAQMGRFGPTRCGPVCTHSSLILLLWSVLINHFKMVKCCDMKMLNIPWTFYTRISRQPTEIRDDRIRILKWAHSLQAARQIRSAVIPNPMYPTTLLTSAQCVAFTSVKYLKQADRPVTVS